MSEIQLHDTLDLLLQFVKESRGFDFTGYKRTTIQRRVEKRMAEVGVERAEDYVDYLQLHGDEYAQLFNAMLINVTGFFRDPLTWEYLATDVIPELIASRPPDSPLRIWAAGCATGEEAYTAAMVLARVLGEQSFRERVKIYATDLDDAALESARLGSYVPRQIEGVPRDALDRFFERTEQRYVFRKDLRRCVIFGRNDLMQDAPISRIDLLICRNTLMYFTAEVQAQILRRLHFALDDDGVLLLGRSEMLIADSDLFTPIDLKRRVFGKVVKLTGRARSRPLAADPGNGASQSVAESLREAAFDLGASARVVLDADGVLIMASAAARRMFGLGVTDLGRPIQDLELSYRPIELRSHLDDVVSTLRSADIKAAPWRTGTHDRALDVELIPILADGVLLGTSIAYNDVTESQRLQDELSTSRRDLEHAYAELQAMFEELETTNEELQSTNELLETTNEELQSSNEELDKMNEELQSSNKELDTMNEELRHRSRELKNLTLSLETALATVGSAVAVIDRKRHIQIWNGGARELWGLTAEQVANQQLLSLDFGLPLELIEGQLTATLSGRSGGEEQVVEAVDSRGQPFDCRVIMLPLRDGDGSGVIMVMEPVPG